MCTVTLVPVPRAPGHGTAPGHGPAAWRVMMNRDELRTRPPAQPPRLVSLGDRRALMPTDTAAGGSWIGVNDRRLVAMLLNLNLAKPGQSASSSAAPGSSKIAPLQSRGLIVPRILSLDTLPQVTTFVSSLNPADYAPFRLVVTDGRVVRVFRGDGAELRVCDDLALTRPLMFTSSGLGDALVESPRRELFNATFPPHTDPADWPDLQRDFQAHRWPDQPQLSVRMARPDASTVSMTTIDVAADRIGMTYRAVVDQQPVGQPTVVELDPRRVAR